MMRYNRRYLFTSLNHAVLAVVVQQLVEKLGIRSFGQFNNTSSLRHQNKLIDVSELTVYVLDGQANSELTVYVLGGQATANDCGTNT